jgi:hypothetical protein
MILCLVVDKCLLKSFLLLVVMSHTSQYYFRWDKLGEFVNISEIYIDSKNFSRKPRNSINIRILIEMPKFAPIFAIKGRAHKPEVYY